MPAPQTYEQRYLAKPADRARNAVRASRRKLYASDAWQRLRLAVLSAEPICRECRRRPGVDIDHIEPLAKRPDLALVQSNLQPLCKACHTKKTREE